MEASDTIVKQIFVKTLNSRLIALDVQASDTVYMVKGMIEEKEGVDLRGQYLSFDGEPLDDSSILYDYNIQEESPLHLELGRKTYRRLPAFCSPADFQQIHFEAADDSDVYTIFISKDIEDFEDIESDNDLVEVLENLVAGEMLLLRSDILENVWRTEVMDERILTTRGVAKDVRRGYLLSFTPA